MEQALLLVAPVVGIALLGFVCTRFNYITQDTADGVARFGYNVVVPVIIFQTMARSGWPERWDNLGAILVGFFGGAAIAMVVGMFLARFLFNSSQSEQRALGIGASHGHVVLVGIAAVTLILKSNLALPMLYIVGLHGLVMSLLVALIGGVFGGKASDLPNALSAAVKKQVRNPLLIAFVVGVAFEALEISLPTAAGTAINTVADAALAVTLFGFGGMMARFRIGGNMQKPATIAAVKLIAQPAATWLLLTNVFVPAYGSWIWMAVMLAAMPTTMGADGPTDRGGGDTTGSTVALNAAAGIVSLTGLVYIILSR